MGCVPGCRPGRCWWLCFAFWLRGGGSSLGLRDGLFVGLWPVGWGSAVRLWLVPPWFGCWFSFTLACVGINHECSSLFVMVIDLIFVLSLWCIIWVGGLCASRVFVCFCVGSCVGARWGWLAVKVLWTPRWFTLLAVLRRWSRCWSYSLLLCGLFYEAFYVLPCVILFLCFFSPYSIVITSLGKVRTNLSAFCTFVRFVLVWFSLSSWCLGRAAVYDCGISWTFILPFFFNMYG